MLVILIVGFFLCRIYFWMDDRGKKSKCSAVQYIDYVTASIEKIVRDDAVFPARHGELQSSTNMLELVNHITQNRFRHRVKTVPKSILATSLQLSVQSCVT